MSQAYIKKVVGEVYDYLVVYRLTRSFCDKVDEIFKLHLSPREFKVKAGEMRSRYCCIERNEFRRFSSYS